MTPLDRIENNFKYHAPKDGQQELYECIRRIGKTFATSIYWKCPESRELSIALTKIEEAVMWANAAIARNN